jgi:YD repeat-containing protein
MQMIRRRFFLKTIAVLFLLEIVVEVFSPSVVWALTAGPTAPEASTFEPIDTTDMVNLVSGDFTYNLPLLEVPGPSGGYPFSLSYHAGIQPNVEASWVGLGFNLNPGAINRSVSGFADDFPGISGTDRRFWEGGETTTYTLGVNFGEAMGEKVSAGLTYADDTYKGVGVGYYVGMSTGGNFGMANMGMSATYGVSPYGDEYGSSGVSAGIGVSQYGASGSADVGISANMDGEISTSSSANVGYSVSGVKANISSQGGASISAGPSTVSGSVNNSKTGTVSTSGYDYTVDVPVYTNISVRLGTSYTRYWSDESEIVSTYGALHFPSTQLSPAALDNRAYDVYDLASSTQSLSSSNPGEAMGGAFIDYDNYQVLGQGVAGSIRPYHFKAYLLRQNRKQEQAYRMKSYPLGVTSYKPKFRFIGDFSNRFVHDVDLDDFQVNSSSVNPLSFSFDPNQITGESGSDGFDGTTNSLPGSKSVEWFTNAQIFDKNRVDENNDAIEPAADAAVRQGFVDHKSRGFVRKNDEAIGGFKITNESGVTYHYALPVMSYDEYTFSGRTDDQHRHSLNTFKRAKSYAYTWLLTAVTGPDFVDQNNNGYADGSDWGYWVTFSYGKWSGAYGWRNPGQGFRKDIDQNFDNFSMGKKEIYYLNSVSTRTHTALFVKDVRQDAKSAVHYYNEPVLINGDSEVIGVDEGGFGSLPRGSYIERPVSSLKLHSIYLFQNKDFPSISSTSNESYFYDLSAVGNVLYHSNNQTADLGKNHHGKNVLDVYDLTTSEFNEKALKKIEFITDYSLCPDTPNSFTSVLDEVDDVIPTRTPVSGKLTLKSVRVYGRGAVSYLPETKFSYGADERFFPHITPVSGNQYRMTIPNFDEFNFRKGDIIYSRYTGSHSTEYYSMTAYVKQVNEAQKQIDVEFYDGLDYLHNLEQAPKRAFYRTKNPSYQKDHVDMWGYFKCDYKEDGSSDNVRRMVTSVSANAVDVWSLRQVTNPLGAKIKIDYETDRYQTALKSLANIPIRGMELIAGNKTKVTLYEDLSEYGLNAQSEVKMRFINAVQYDVRNPGQYTELRFNCQGHDYQYMIDWYTDDSWSIGDGVDIESVNGATFVVNRDFTFSFPITGVNNGTCIEESPPYLHHDKQPDLGCVGLNNLTMSAPWFIGGEVISNNLFTSYGGGLRVKKISVEVFDKVRSTNYEYENGVTSYEPVGVGVPLKKIPNESIYQCLEELQQAEINNYRDKYILDVYGRFKDLFANSRELPGPSVMYERVTVREKVERLGSNADMTEIPGKVTYLFEVFSPTSVDLENQNHGPLNAQWKNQYSSAPAGTIPGSYSGTVSGLSVNKIETRNRATLKDFSAIMGSLKKTTLYDGSSNKISETINHYLHDDFDANVFEQTLRDKYKDQGRIDETFVDARLLLNPTNDDPPTFTLHGLISQKIRYPSIQLGQTTINYRTGITTKTENRAFDFYSGAVVKTLTKDGMGRAIMQETLPAYKFYDAMKQTAFGGKNMLSQQAGTYVYQVSGEDYDQIDGLLSASIQTWSDQINVLHPWQTAPWPGIWRTHETYNFIGDKGVELTEGLYPVSNNALPDFDDWLHEAGEPKIVDDIWQRNSAVTLYDMDSRALEAEDMYGLFSATRVTVDGLHVLATALNARYNEFVYSGADENMGSGILPKGLSYNINQLSNSAHIGEKGLAAQASNATYRRGFIFSFSPTPSRTYRANVWSTSNTAMIRYKIGPSGTPVDAVTKVVGKVNSWYLLEADITPESSTAMEIWCESMSGTTYFDDFRVCPFDGSMISYVYNRWGELTHIIDNNHLFTEYRYDDMGRLTETYKETFDHGYTRTSETKYHYANGNN